MYENEIYIYTYRYRYVYIYIYIMVIDYMGTDTGGVLWWELTELLWVTSICSVK